VDAVDAEGDGCMWYRLEQDGFRFSDYCGEYDDADFVAEELCCACKVPSTPAPVASATATPEPAPKPTPKPTAAPVSSVATPPPDFFSAEDGARGAAALASAALAVAVAAAGAY